MLEKDNTKIEIQKFDLSTHEFYKRDPERHKKFLKFLWKSIWYIPFDKYENYYLNGKIFEMTQQEKIDMTVKDYIDNQKVTFFTRIIRIRPNILNNDDYELYEKEFGKVKKGNYLSLFILLGHCSFFTFKMTLNRDFKHMKSFLIGNIFIMIFYFYVKSKENMLTTYLYNKYEKYINFDEMRSVIIKSENKDNN